MPWRNFRSSGQTIGKSEINPNFILEPKTCTEKIEVEEER